MRSAKTSEKWWAVHHFAKFQSRLEDVKKLISLSFRDFIFDPKCLPTSQRSLIRHPGAILFTPSSLQILKTIFSHVPDHKSLTTNLGTLLTANGYAVALLFDFVLCAFAIFDGGYYAVCRREEFVIV
jgi:hypothetical protein